MTDVENINYQIQRNSEETVDVLKMSRNVCVLVI